MVENEITLYDIADWLWSYRWLALGIALAAVAATIALAVIKNDRASQFTASFEVNASGTPVRSVPEIVDILTAKVRGGAVVSGQGANPVLISYDTKEKADEAVAAVRQIETELVADVLGRLEDLRVVSGDNDYSITPILQNKSFVRGIDSGLVTLIRSDVSEVVPAQSRSRLLVPAALGSFVFILILAIHSFWRGWRRRRKVAV